MKLTAYIILLFFSLIETSFAYLDPGTGFGLIQMIIAFFASVAATAIFYWRKLLIFINRILKKENKDNNKD
jgi:hypothetical protein